MSANLDNLIPELAESAKNLDQAVHEAGLRGQFTSTLRSHAEQKRLFDRFIAGNAKFPALPPGQSAHEYGWAFDYVVSPFGYQEEVGETWRSWGGVWGGKQDVVHFEYPGFQPPAQNDDDVAYSVYKVLFELYGPLWTAFVPDKYLDPLLRAGYLINPAVSGSKALTKIFSYFVPNSSLADLVR